MICDPCREAGKLNTDAQRVYDPVSKVYLEHRAMEKHGECEGWSLGTGLGARCNCQHKTGDFSNRRSDG